MRRPELVTKEIQDLDKLYLQAVKLYTQFPDDNILRLSIEQIESRKQNLITELSESLKFYGRHSIQYIFDDIKEAIRLEILIEHLNVFSSLLNKTFEKITSGKQNHFPIYFHVVYSGSYGIQLSTPSEENLFPDYEQTLGQTIKTLTDLVNSTDEELNTVFKKNFEEDVKLLSTYSSFFNRIHRDGKKIQIIWDSPISKETKSLFIEPEKAKVLHLRLREKEKREETITLYGILKGLSLINYKVEFLKEDEEKEVLTAKFNETLSEEVKNALDKYVTAVFKVNVKFNEVKGEIGKDYELIAIAPPQRAL